MTNHKVLIITTGGTIASKTNAPLIEGAQLIKAIPELAQYGTIEVEEFVRIGSSKMTPQIWLKLAKRINVILDEKPDITCIIITHGTDSMEETAFFLNLTHKKSVPIILVGSMRSSNEVSADGPLNLLNAVRTGTSPEAIGKGVMIVMNENIIAGRDLIKGHNRRVDAFPAPEVGFMGSIDPEKVTFYRFPFKKHTVNSEFEINKLDSFPEIDIVQDFTGLDEEILNFFLNRSNQGLVISSFAGGRTSSGMAQIFQLTNIDKPIVIASSIKGGRIMGSHQQGSSVIIANDLPANKARILLMLALTKTNDGKEIQRIFNDY